MSRTKFEIINLLIGLFLVLFLIYFFFFNYLEPTQIGIVRNIFTGELKIQDTGGIHFTSPWEQVARIDTRPLRVDVPSTGHGFSAKLVQFNKDNWRDFVTVEGFRYYWWGNRFSINFGYSEEYRGMRDIMRGYAYSTKKYPFISILNEYQ